jgi:hypothetical protein
MPIRDSKKTQRPPEGGLAPSGRGILGLYPEPSALGAFYHEHEAAPPDMEVADV